MTNLPPLRELAFRTPEYGHYPYFVKYWVELHDRNWHTAELHWLKVLNDVLDTKEIGRRSHNLNALRRAISATIDLLTTTYLNGKCPICPRPKVVSGERADPGEPEPDEEASVGSV